MCQTLPMKKLIIQVKFPFLQITFIFSVFFSSDNLALKYSFQDCYASNSVSGTSDTPMNTTDMVFIFSKFIA